MTSPATTFGGKVASVWLEHRRIRKMPERSCKLQISDALTGCMTWLVPIVAPRRTWTRMAAIFTGRALSISGEMIPCALLCTNQQTSRADERTSRQTTKPAYVPFSSNHHSSHDSQPSRIHLVLLMNPLLPTDTSPRTPIHSRLQCSSSASAPLRSVLGYTHQSLATRKGTRLYRLPESPRITVIHRAVVDFRHIPTASQCQQSVPSFNLSSARFNRALPSVGQLTPVHQPAHTPSVQHPG